MSRLHTVSYKKFQTVFATGDHQLAMTLLTFDTRTVTAKDGTQLATYSYGQGETPAIIANGLGGTLIAWTPLLEALSDVFTFVSWDYRGLYDSARPQDTEAFTVAHHVSDMQTVMDAYAIDKAAAFGWSEQERARALKAHVLQQRAE